MSATLQQQYYKTIQPKLQKKFGLNVMATPRLERIVVNAGVGRFMKDKAALSNIERDLQLITGQKPVPALARKSISSFSVREGALVGYYATLRGERMYDFLQRLIGLAFPRVRDFRGISSKGFDGNGNFSFGIREQEIFPEVAHDDISTTFGLQVTLVISTKDDEQSEELLREFGFPFAEGELQQLTK